LAEFATRRVGREAYERLVQPLVAGIYTADPTRLSMKAALPQFVDMERRHGGLLRAALRGHGAGASERKAGGARYDLFAAPRDGMETLVQAVAARLPDGCVRLNAAVNRIDRVGSDQWQVELVTGERQTFDGVVVATAAPA